MQSFPEESRSWSDSISGRIAFHAAATPEQVAVADETSCITYRDLERRSGLLALQLWALGAGRERCVGLFLERSTQFVISALAVLRSGAAYVPIDPATPPDRLNLILSDAGAIAVITSPSKTSHLPKGNWQVIEADSSVPVVSGTFARFDSANEDLAYVIYTSGSTGRPKGVEITHASLLNLIKWHQEAFEVTKADHASQVAGLGFDAAVWEIWPYLTAGATLYVADEVTRSSADLLRDWLVEKKITISFVPTVLAEQLLETEWPPATQLRILLTGGDALHRRPNARLPFRFVNNYGPTECTVVATSGTVAPCEDSSCMPTIGAPIANATAFVLDDTLRPVTPGEPGELCLGGALVGRGYRNLPDQTAKQFVTYITASGESLRIYRTGDRVRLLQGGEIEFIGRVDDQVKIRGYRVELGEIVACLNRNPGVAASAVIVHDAGDAGPSLIAYVVGKSGVQLTDFGLREFLASSLPAYMIPASFVSIATLPTTPNGKLDKSALPAPSAENLLPAEAEDEAAVSQHDNTFLPDVSALVASLLERPSIGPEENFFMVGGHSMLGVQLVAQIRDKFHVKLSLRQLFSAPTIAALADEVARLSHV